MCSIALASGEINSNQYYNKILVHLRQVAKIQSDEDSGISIGTVRPEESQKRLRHLSSVSGFLSSSGWIPNGRQSKELGERLSMEWKDTLKK